MTHSNADFLAQFRDALTERERAVLAKRELYRNKHIETEWESELRRKFDTLMRATLTRQMSCGEPLANARHEARCLFVTGEAGAGKTTCLNRLLNTHPVFQSRGEQRSPLLRVSVQAPCTLKSLGRAVLKGLGFPLAREKPDHLIWAQILDILPTSGVLVIHFDEMHNLTDNANIAQMDNIRKTFKTLMVSPWPVGLIVSGLPSLVPEMRRIDEIRRRGQFVSVPLLSLPDDNSMVSDIIGGLAEVAGITVEAGVANHIAPRLIHGALYRFGMAIEFVHEAIELALLDEKPLSTEHFATAYADRTGCGARMNPFVSPGWAELDCTLVLADDPPLDTDAPVALQRRGRKSRKGERT
ncbi:ATP-binding protein [Bosea sp. (in: a-proteobacteria)]|uniref:ATP-binding protein n=1 Tax=Bosea sp. (in: a-proteobacteria) TaxID=1871050 RepID=UPI002735D65E|nr:ATP-binding protein [Bosea sp. (in: a-proteobacteria)]MDP3256712.1 ATP-binding protein [Bosea sp. (in: a-proteobacteria)]